MEDVNFCIGCEVNKCKFNVEGKNCSLSRIHVGCGRSNEQCTCCDSFEERNRVNSSLEHAKRVQLSAELVFHL